jgi:hypothetical protein
MKLGIVGITGLVGEKILESLKLLNIKVLSNQISGIILMDKYKEIDETINKECEVKKVDIEEYCFHYLTIYGEELISFLPEHILLKYLISLVNDNNFAKLGMLEPILRSRESYVYLKAQLKFEQFVLKEVKNNATIEILGRKLTTLSDLDISSCFLIKEDLIVSCDLLNNQIFYFNIISLTMFQKMLKLIKLNNYLEEDNKVLLDYIHTKKVIENCRKKLKIYYDVK